MVRKNSAGYLPDVEVDAGKLGVVVQSSKWGTSHRSSTMAVKAAADSTSRHGPGLQGAGDHIQARASPCCDDGGEFRAMGCGNLVQSQPPCSLSNCPARRRRPGFPQTGPVPPPSPGSLHARTFANCPRTSSAPVLPGVATASSTWLNAGMPWRCCGESRCVEGSPGASRRPTCRHRCRYGLTALMYTWSRSGRSAIDLDVDIVGIRDLNHARSSKDSWAMTWHQ